MLVPPFLTPARIRTAYILAGSVDLMQLLLGPFGWGYAAQISPAADIALLWRIIGFHPLLLPTFALEIVPLADMLPTWTACVAVVIALRKRQQAAPPAGGTVIDV